MHEYSVVQSMVEQIERLAHARGAHAVRRVRVRLGQLSGVDPDLLRTAYDTFRVRTLCDGAPLDVETVPPVWTCPEGHGAIPCDAPLSCRTCGRPARLESGDEILLDRLELEVP
jgi:hydrogenase nickel incorporation protein HypA/HybF